MYEKVNPKHPDKKEIKLKLNYEETNLIKWSLAYFDEKNKIMASKSKAKDEKKTLLNRAKKCNELFKLFDKIEDEKFIK